MARLRLALRGVQALLVGGAAGVLAYYQLNPDSNLSSGWVKFYVAVVVVAGVVPTLLEGYLEFRVDASAVQARKVDELLRGTFGALVDTAKVDWHTLRLNVFLVRWSFWRWWWIPMPHRVQKRLTQLRMKSAPAPSHIRWTKHKGLVGRAWDQGVLVAENMAPIYKPLRGCTKEVWESQPASVRMGMSHSEFWRVEGYGLVMVCPIIRDGGKYLGCVSIDAPAEDAERLLVQHRAAAEEQLQAVARTVRGLVFK
jgi:hypothetical protein